MRQTFAKRPLRQRVIALAAAYAIALSSLFASFAAAYAEAAGAAGLNGAICHTVSEDPQSPGPAGDDGAACVDNCCKGCLTLFAALPPPPIKMLGVPQSAARSLPPRVPESLAAAPAAKSHRSRAPPLPA